MHAAVAKAQMDVRASDLLLPFYVYAQEEGLHGICRALRCRVLLPDPEREKIVQPEFDFRVQDLDYPESPTWLNEGTYLENTFWIATDFKAYSFIQSHGYRYRSKSFQRSLQYLSEAYWALRLEVKASGPAVAFEHARLANGGFKRVLVLLKPIVCQHSIVRNDIISIISHFTILYDTILCHTVLYYTILY